MTPLRGFPAPRPPRVAACRLGETRRWDWAKDSVLTRFLTRLPCVFGTPCLFSQLATPLPASARFSLFLWDVWVRPALYQRRFPSAALGTCSAALAAGLTGPSCPGSSFPSPGGGPLASFCWAPIPSPVPLSLLVFAFVLEHIHQLLLETGAQRAKFSRSRRSNEVFILLIGCRLEVTFL